MKCKFYLNKLYCIVLYLYIYIALPAVHTNQKRFQCERPREKRAVLRERKEAVLRERTEILALLSLKQEQATEVPGLEYKCCNFRDVSLDRPIKSEPNIRYQDNWSTFIWSTINRLYTDIWPTYMYISSTTSLVTEVHVAIVMACVVTVNI